MNLWFLLFAVYLCWQTFKRMRHMLNYHYKYIAHDLLFDRLIYGRWHFEIWPQSIASSQIFSLHAKTCVNVLAACRTQKMTKKKLRKEKEERKEEKNQNQILRDCLSVVVCWRRASISIYTRFHSIITIAGSSRHLPPHTAIIQNKCDVGNTYAAYRLLYSLALAARTNERTVRAHTHTYKQAPKTPPNKCAHKMCVYINPSMAHKIIRNLIVT